MCFPKTGPSELYFRQATRPSAALVWQAREARYRAMPVMITLPDGSREQMETFVAENAINDLPFDWNRDPIVEGAI